MQRQFAPGLEPHRAEGGAPDLAFQHVVDAAVVVAHDQAPRTANRVKIAAQNKAYRGRKREVVLALSTGVKSRFDVPPRPSPIR